MNNRTNLKKKNIYIYSNKKHSQKLFGYFLILTILISHALQFPYAVLAQEDVKENSSINAENKAVADVNREEEGTPAPSPVFEQSGSARSAAFKLPPIVRMLNKKNFRSNENITLKVDNVTSQKVDVEVTNADGEDADIDVYSTQTGESKSFIIKSSRVFKPGKYKITVTVDGQQTTQDFTWGVLAINTDKSIYLPNEIAGISIGVLDEVGQMVCDAEVSLTITGPDNKSTQLTTGNDIKINPECKTHAVTLTPDYQTSYQVHTVGTYTMEHILLVTNLK